MTFIVSVFARKCERRLYAKMVNLSHTTQPKINSSTALAGSPPPGRPMATRAGASLAQPTSETQQNR